MDTGHSLKQVQFHFATPVISDIRKQIRAMKFLRFLNQNLNQVIQSISIHNEARRSNYGLIFLYKRHFSTVPRRSLCKEDDSILPVLIVGAGPVGLVLSILLTKLGIPFFLFSFLSA